MDIYLTCTESDLRLCQQLKGRLKDAGFKTELKSNKYDYYTRLDTFTRLSIDLASICVVVDSKNSDTSMRLNEELQYIRYTRKDHIIIDNGAVQAIMRQHWFMEQPADKEKRSQKLLNVRKLVEDFIQLEWSKTKYRVTNHSLNSERVLSG